MTGGSVVLAIEASQREGGVAVRDRDGGAHAEGISTDTRYDDDLLPAIDRLYKRCGLQPGDTGVVGVSVGPGGFTGLRIAVSTAKMLAESTGARLVAVPSALVVAQRAAHSRPILVALASKDDTAWVTRLQRTPEGSWQADDEGHLLRASELPLDGVAALYGDGYLPAPFREACTASNVPVEAPTFDPLACLEATERSAAASCFTDPLRLGPLYPRPPSAVTNWKRP